MVTVTITLEESKALLNWLHDSLSSDTSMPAYSAMVKLEASIRSGERDSDK